MNPMIKPTIMPVKLAKPESSSRMPMELLVEDQTDQIVEKQKPGVKSMSK